MKKQINDSMQLTRKQLIMLIVGICLISILTIISGMFIIKKFTNYDKTTQLENPINKSKQEKKNKLVEKYEPEKTVKQIIEEKIVETPLETSSFFETLPDSKKNNAKIIEKTFKKALVEKVLPDTLPKVKSKSETSQSQQKRNENIKGIYTVQVASYTKDKSAEKLSSLLNKKGYDAYVTIATVPKRGTFYRVRIGDFSNKTKASQIADLVFQKEAKAMGFGRPLVTFK